jgi:ribonuclease J
MQFNIKDNKNNLLFIPLGGTNEIGINVNLYHYKGKYIMIDCGSGFADDRLPGVDMVIADLKFIIDRKKDLLAIIITHAHEDHIGALQYLWQSLGCPIYATNFTANFLRIRFQEYKFAKTIKINALPESAKINLDPFFLEMIPLTHSAPEMQAIMIRTDAGNIFHTGDWKLDNDPVICPKSNIDKLKSIGDEGVLALVCDSTNVFNEGWSGSEGVVRKSLAEIISNCPQMVVVATFASNLARMDSLMNAAREAGRKVILTGRSLHRVFEAAQATGYLNYSDLVYNEREISRFKREEILVIATGCQGEPLAATSKMAYNVHNSIKLSRGDSVIFSSKIIPGNEKKIFSLFNHLVKLGIEVITERDHFVHVSGHPSVDELKYLYSLIKPHILIPVHGEPVHIHEHIKLGKKNDIKHTIEVENGSVALLHPNDYKIIGSVENGYLAVDGNYLLPADSEIFKMRRRMRDAGIVIVSLFIDKNYKLLAKPILSMPGLLDACEDKQLLDLIKNDIEEMIEIHIANKISSKISIESIEKIAKSAVRKTLKHEMNKSPAIIINIEKSS